MTCSIELDTNDWSDDNPAQSFRVVFGHSAQRMASLEAVSFLLLRCRFLLVAGKRLFSFARLVPAQHVEPAVRKAG